MLLVLSFICASCWLTPEELLKCLAYQFDDIYKIEKFIARTLKAMLTGKKTLLHFF
jgi:hypothetical protein